MPRVKSESYLPLPINGDLNPSQGKAGLIDKNSDRTSSGDRWCCFCEGREPNPDHRFYNTYPLLANFPTDGRVETQDLYCTRLHSIVVDLCPISGGHVVVIPNEHNRRLFGISMNGDADFTHTLDVVDYVNKDRFTAQFMHNDSFEKRLDAGESVIHDHYHCTRLPKDLDPSKILGEIVQYFEEEYQARIVRLEGITNDNVLSKVRDYVSCDEEFHFYRLASEAVIILLPDGRSFPSQEHRKVISGLVRDGPDSAWDWHANGAPATQGLDEPRSLNTTVGYITGYSEPEISSRNANEEDINLDAIYPSGLSDEERGVHLTLLLRVLGVIAQYEMTEEFIKELNSS